MRKAGNYKVNQLLTWFANTGSARGRRLPLRTRNNSNATAAPAFSGAALEGVRMPRFFFHLYDDRVALDPKGRELPSVARAKEVAVRDARALASAEVREGHLGLNHRIEVTDANDGPVATVHFKDVIAIHP
jgi:hypothetical protein